jgi:hypothetical protein
MNAVNEPILAILPTSFASADFTSADQQKNATRRHSEERSDEESLLLFDLSAERRAFHCARIDD